MPVELKYTHTNPKFLIKKTPAQQVTWLQNLVPFLPSTGLQAKVSTRVMFVKFLKKLKKVFPRKKKCFPVPKRIQVQSELHNAGRNRKQKEKEVL